LRKKPAVAEHQNLPETEPAWPISSFGAAPHEASNFKRLIFLQMMVAA